MTSEPPHNTAPVPQRLNPYVWAPRHSPLRRSPMRDDPRPVSCQSARRPASPQRSVAALGTPLGVVGRLVNDVYSARSAPRALFTAPTPPREPPQTQRSRPQRITSDSTATALTTDDAARSDVTQSSSSHPDTNAADVKPTAPSEEEGQGPVQDDAASSASAPKTPQSGRGSSGERAVAEPEPDRGGGPIEGEHPAVSEPHEPAAQSPVVVEEPEGGVPVTAAQPTDPREDTDVADEQRRPDIEIEEASPVEGPTAPKQEASVLELEQSGSGGKSSDQGSDNAEARGEEVPRVLTPAAEEKVQQAATPVPAEDDGADPTPEIDEAAPVPDETAPPVSSANDNTEAERPAPVEPEPSHNEPAADIPAGATTSPPFTSPSDWSGFIEGSPPSEEKPSPVVPPCVQDPPAETRGLADVHTPASGDDAAGLEEDPRSPPPPPLLPLTSPVIASPGGEHDNGIGRFENSEIFSSELSTPKAGASPVTRSRGQSGRRQVVSIVPPALHGHSSPVPATTTSPERPTSIMASREGLPPSAVRTADSFTSVPSVTVATPPASRREPQRSGSGSLDASATFGRSSMRGADEPESEWWGRFKAYMIVKTCMRRWRKKRMARVPEQYAKKPGQGDEDDEEEMLQRIDSFEWLQVFYVDDLKVKGRSLGRAAVRVSTSHVRVTSDNDECARTIRLADVARVVPMPRGLELRVYTNFGSGSRDWADPEASNERNVEPLQLKLAPGNELTAVTVFLLDVHAQVMQKYGARVSRSLRTLKLRSKRTLHVVHFNDVYHLPHFKPPGSRGVVGGASRFHTVLAKIREDYNPLVLFSGDFMGPSLMSVITKGKQMIDAFNFLGVHYGCFGNHEFDFGLRTLKEVVHGYTQGKHIYPGSQTTWIMSNMTEADGSPLGGVKEYAVCKWNGIKVGLLGLCEDWISGCTYLKSGEAAYHDMFEVGERMARRLKAEGAELVLALTHNRLHNDRELMQCCPSIDYLLGGHDHFFKNEPKNRILKSGQEFEFLSFVEFELGDPGTGLSRVKVDAKPITYDTPESEYMQGLISRYDAKLRENLGKHIGTSAVELDSTEECIRFKEGRLTNFILDVMQDEAATDFAILCGAAIAGKEAKPPGPVTVGDVFGWFPKDTLIMTVALSGATVAKVLDLMAEEIPAEAPSFPHPSRNLSFTVNMFTKPPSVRDVFVRGQPLRPEQRYVVAMDDFLGTGLGKFGVIHDEGEVLVSDEMAPQLAHWVMDFFTKHKGCGEESTAQREREKAVLTVTKAVHAAARLEMEFNMANFVQHIETVVCQHLHAARALLFLVDESTGEFWLEGTEHRFPRAAGLTGMVVLTGEDAHVPDVEEDDDFDFRVDQPAGCTTRNLIATPVMRHGACVAVLQAADKDDDAEFTEVDQLVLRVLGEQVSFHLRNYDLFEEAKRVCALQRDKDEARRRSQHRSTSTTTANGALEPRVASAYQAFSSDVRVDRASLFRAISEYALKLVHAERCYTVLFDRDVRQSGDLAAKVRSGSPVPPEHALGTADLVTLAEEVDEGEALVTVSAEEGTLLHQVLLTGEPALCNDARVTPVMTLRRDLNDVQVETAIVVPIRNDGEEPQGAVCWVNRRDHGAKADFSDRDLTLATVFGEFCAVAFENTLRVEGLNTMRQESALQAVPEQPLGRIKFRGGWRTVREKLPELGRIMAAARAPAESAEQRQKQQLKRVASSLAMSMKDGGGNRWGAVRTSVTLATTQQGNRRASMVGSMRRPSVVSFGTLQQN